MEEKPLAEIPYEEHRLRLEKLKELMGEFRPSLDALLIFGVTNIRYYSGFVKASSAMFPLLRRCFIVPVDGDPVLVGQHGMEPARITTWVKDIRVQPDPNPFALDQREWRNLLIDTVKDLKLDKKVLGIDLDPVWCSMWGYYPWVSPRDLDYIKVDLMNAKFVDAYEIPREQRMCKTDYEIGLFTRCCEITMEAFRKAFEVAREGVTEMELNKVLWKTFIDGGGLVSEGTLIGRMTIDASGRVLGWPMERKLGRGDFLTFNGGGCYRGYHSDVSRFFSVGQPSSDQKKLVEAVYAAHDAAYELYMPGNKISDVVKAAHKAAHKIVPKAYCWGAGHGIGLDCHEYPWFDRGIDVVLKPGMIMAIEPMIWASAEQTTFAGNVENDVVITEDGNENLTEKLSREIVVV